MLAINKSLPKSAIVNGDAISLTESLASCTVSLVLTDPPYGIAKEGITGRSDNISYEGVLNKIRAPWDEPYQHFKRLFKGFYRALRPGGTLIVFYNGWYLGSIRDEALKAGFKSPRIIVWEKTNCIPINSKTHYLSNSKEFAVVCVKGSNPIFNSEYDTGVYQYPFSNRRELGIEHPTQKSLGLFKELISKHSVRDELVFDPFCGSNITGVAARALGRRYIGGDLSRDYVMSVVEKYSSDFYLSERVL